MFEKLEYRRTVDAMWLKRSVLSILVLAMTNVFADETGEEDPLTFQENGIAIGSDENDARALRKMANHAGITLTPETIKHMLEAHPEVLDAMDSAEWNTITPSAAAIYPARFEVTGQAKIYEDTMYNLRSAGGRFTSGGIDVLLNYSSVLGGISYENMAFSGSSHSNEIEAKLAVDAEFEAFGVYGRADAGPPPFPAVTYGVYGTTSRITGYGVYASNTSPEGNTLTTGGGVALFATGAIRGNRTSGYTDHIDNHVAIIENKSTGNTHVLALSMPNDGGTVSSDDNFITFYHGGITSADAVGAIEGDSGGVNYKSGSADFAEWIPRQNSDEIIEAGDIVSIAGGKVSRNLSRAEHVQVISTSPAFTGNDPGYDKRDQYALVSMMGQVPVKVAGAVKAGDYIVASGKNDGTGIAISADKMTLRDFRMMVGRAWKSSDEQGIKLVKTAVGLGASDAYGYMHNQDQRIASLERQLSSKMAKLDRLASQMQMLTQKVAYIQSANQVAKALAK